MSNFNGNRPPQGGRTGQGGNNFNAPPPPTLPEGYLKGGYFDENGNIRAELLTGQAEAIARAIGQPYGGIANAQLRKFYGHVRVADTRLRYDAQYEAVCASVLELSAFVAEARGKNKVPQVFKEFIDRNLQYIRSEKAFRQGFVKHFQAVVGFFSYIYPRA